MKGWKFFKDQRIIPRYRISCGDYVKDIESLASNKDIEMGFSK